MASKPIPGWTYMILGLAIMGYTKFIQSKSPGAKIGIFFWVGIAFLVFGIVREFVPRIMAKKQPKAFVGPPPANHAQHPAHGAAAQHPAGHPFQQSPHATHSHVQPQQHPSHPYTPLHKQCPRCHVLTHGQGRFCHNCGHQFY